jgi:hypothetical protein
MTVRDALTAQLTDPAPVIVEEQPAPDAVTPPAASSSIIAALRARAAQLAHETTVDLEVPGYNGVLVGRYRAVPLSSIWATPQGQMRNAVSDWEVGADVLTRALEELLGRNAEGGLEPLAFDGPTRFDDDLVQMLSLEPSARTARAVLIALCGGGDVALGQSRVWAHFMAYQSWLMQGAGEQTQEVAEQIVGEYPAA